MWTVWTVTKVTRLGCRTPDLIPALPTYLAHIPPSRTIQMGSVNKYPGELCICTVHVYSTLVSYLIVILFEALRAMEFLFNGLEQINKEIGPVCVPMYLFS